MRYEDILVRHEDIHIIVLYYLCSRKNNEIAIYMEVSFIIAVALATVLMLIIIGLIVALAYYRWRNTELMAGISYFIRSNWKMEQEINKLEKELQIKKNTL